MSLIEELRRRRVFRVALAYLAGSWLLIQVLETLFPIFGLPATSIRIIVVLLAICFLPAVSIAWIFQWTPAGLKRDSDLPRESAKTSSSRSFDRIIIALLTIAVVYFSVDRFIIRSADGIGDLAHAEEVARDYAREHPRNDTSIAVLPFTSAANDERSKHFASGLSDEIRVSLARIGELRVIARSSVVPYGESQRSASELGEILGVGQILTGRVRRSSNQVRIHAELTDTTTGELLWANSFDAELTLDNVLDIQDGISAAVTAELQDKLGSKSTPENVTQPQSLAALDAYHDGSYYLNLLFQDSNPSDDDARNLATNAENKFEEAINSDPNWAPPRVMLGRLFHLWWNISGDPADLATSRRHILDALRLDDKYGPAYASYAYLLDIDREYDAALEQYQRSISLGSMDSYWGLGILYRQLGRHEDAIQAFLQAVSVDPLILPLRWQLAQTYYCAGHYQEAIDDFVEYFPEEKNDIKHQILLANAYTRVGDFGKALELAESVVSMTGNEAVVASAFFLAGETERARQAVLQNKETAPFIVLDIVPALILLGNENRALQMLEQAATFVSAELGDNEQRDWIWHLRCSPEVQGLAGNARYDAILAEFGLPN